jgi:hypothetical protein
MIHLQTPAERLILLRAQLGDKDARKRSEILHELLTLLHAMPDLPGGVRIAQNAMCILRELEKRPQAEGRRTLRRYVEELHWLIHNAQWIALKIFTTGSDRELFLRLMGSNPCIRRGVKEHGLWSLLWERHPQRMLSRQFRTLQGHVVIAHIRVLRYWTVSNDWNLLTKRVFGSLYDRTLALKHFVMPRYEPNVDYRRVLASIPIRGSRIECLQVARKLRFHHAQSILDEQSPPQIFLDLISIAGTLRLAEQPERIRDARDREDEVDETETGPTSDESTIKRAKLIDMTPDSDSGEGEVGKSKEVESEARAYSRQEWSESQEFESSEAGEHPLDAYNASEFVVGPTKDGGPRYWVQMRNQSLSLDWSNLSMFELATGLRMLKEAARTGNALEQELFAAVIVMLARSLDETAIRSLIVRSDRPPEAISTTLVIDANLSWAEWLIPAVPIRYQSAQNQTFFGCRPTVSVFAMPDYWRLSETVLAVLHDRVPDWNGEPVRLFAHDEIWGETASFSARLADTFSRIDPSRARALKDRFTPARLQRTLFQSILDQTGGNYVLSTYATQKTHPAGEVGRYYDTPAISTIQSAECRAVHAISNDLARSGYDWPVDSMPAHCDSAGYVGSSMCPTTASLRAFIRDISETIRSFKVKLQDTTDDVTQYIPRHNAYTVLTYVVVTLGTCHRPAHGGMPIPSEIDRFTGLLSIADKGLRKGRLAVAIAGALAQLDAYQRYLASFLAERFTCLQPVGSGFLFDSEGNAVPVSPSSLRPHLPFVANFARHYVRTMLAERCVEKNSLTVEDLSALLGHATRGEEPFGPFSSFSYQEYAEVLHEELTNLLNELEFCPLTIEGEEILTFEVDYERF